MASGLMQKELLQKYLDPKSNFNTYFDTDSHFKEDAVTLPMQQLVKVFSSGAVKGETLIAFGFAHHVHHLLAPCSAFKEIIIADYIDADRHELEKWLKKDAGALDWTEHVKCVCELEGKRDRWTEKEEELRRAIKQVVKCDVTESEPLAPLHLPPADCLHTSYYLETFCLDQDSYCCALKNVSSLLKTGGHLVMLSFFGATYFMVGKYKFPILCLDEEFVRKALTDAGYAIEELKVNPRVCTGLYNITDSAGVLFLVARKERDAK